MIKNSVPVVVTALLGVCLALLVSCGNTSQKEATLTPQQADSLLDSLDRVSSDFVADDCEGAADALASAEYKTDSLGPSVDEELKTQLGQGLEHLRQLLREECTQTETTKTTTTKTSTTPTQTQTTTPTTTVPTTTTTTTTPTTTTPPPTTPTPTTTTPPEDPGDGGSSPSGGIETPQGGQ